MVKLRLRISVKIYVFFLGITGTYHKPFSKQRAFAQNVTRLPSDLSNEATVHFFIPECVAVVI